MARSPENDRALEHHCRFVSSRGIVRSCTTHMAEPQSGKRWIPREMAFRIWGDVDVIHLPTEALSRFVRRHMWRIWKPFILVTGDSTRTVNTDLFQSDVLLSLLKHRHLKAWYAQNLAYEHPKLKPIPLGLDYHTLSRIKAVGDTHDWGQGANPIDQEKQLIATHIKAGPIREKTCQAFANWHFARERGNRQDCLTQAPPDSLFFQPSFLKRDESWALNASFAFTASPLGNGLDCHRTWEAMLLGSIPVVVKSPLDPLYEDLPVLILDSWSEMTTTRLSEELERMSETQYDFSRLDLRYWVDLINGRERISGDKMTMDDFRLSLAGN